VVGELLSERVAAILPEVSARARETEQLRRIPDATIAALRAAGVFRTLVPVRYGGLEVAPSALWDALIEIARACSATGWVASLLAVHGFVLARFDRQAQEEVWSAGPDALAASGVAPSGTGTPVDGGLRVSGRWSYASGVDHCAWATLNVHVHDSRQPDAKPASQFVLLPATCQSSSIA
jgi:alkylation response protein AidB-like acyl-CoA dehydrogenase